MALNTSYDDTLNVSQDKATGDKSRTLEAKVDDTETQSEAKEEPKANDSGDSVILVEDGKCAKEAAKHSDGLSNGNFPQDDLTDNDTPVFQIRFRDIEVYGLYADKIMRELEKMAAAEKLGFIDHRDDDGVNSLNVYRLREPDLEANVILAEVEPQKDASEAEFFMVDTQPAEKLNAVKVPSYKRSRREVFEEAKEKPEKDDDDTECKRPKPTVVCFNCGFSDHCLRMCPKQRNMKRINRAKKAHMMNRERYHVDMEQKYGDLRPGQLSSELRNALDLQDDELPFFYYRMRILGYPPGWLEHAKVEHSGIVLFDGDGKELDSESNSNGHAKYDVSKIVEFPGFNKYPGKHFYDDYKLHNVPPMSWAQMKDEFVKSLGDNIINGYKRKKLADLSSSQSSDSPYPEAIDMELVDSDNEENQVILFSRPPAPTDRPNEEELPPLPPESPTEEGEISDEDSLTLESLQEEQRKLLEQLNDSGLETLSSNTNTENPREEGEVEEDTDQHDVTCQNNGHLEQESPCTPVATSATGNSHFKKSFVGTPVLHFSPYEKLPSDESFKKGVSDVINFENLPDSTGKYEQMKELLKKVRRKVATFNDE